MKENELFIEIKKCIKDKFKREFTEFFLQRGKNCFQIRTNILTKEDIFKKWCLWKIKDLLK